MKKIINPWLGVEMATYMFNAILSDHPTLAFSHRVQKSVLYICVSFAILHIGSLEKAMAPHSSTLAWKIPWVEEPGRQQSMGLLRVRHDCAASLSLFTFMHWRREWQPTPVFLPGESQGRESLVDCRLLLVFKFLKGNSRFVRKSHIKKKAYLKSYEIFIDK